MGEAKRRGTFEQRHDVKPAIADCDYAAAHGAKDRLRERAQNEQTCIALSKLCKAQKERIAGLEAVLDEWRHGERTYPPAKQSYNDMLAYMNGLLSEDRVVVCELKAAARALIERWDTPAWKDVPATGNYINALREALGG